MFELIYELMLILFLSFLKLEVQNEILNAWDTFYLYLFKYYFLVKIYNLLFALQRIIYKHIHKVKSILI